MRRLLLLVILLAVPASPAQANLWGKVKIACPLAVIAQDDPLVAPGEEGESDHNHAAYCSKAFSSTMTTGAMYAAETTSFLRENHSSAWVATFDKDGVSYAGSFSTYYAGNGADPAGIAGGKIQPFPPGLRFVWGDSHSPILQSVSFVRWRCGEGVATYDRPPTAANCSTGFKLEIDGPECWNGQDLDSPDHKSHMARQVGRSCPADHPIRLPQLQVSFSYPAAALGGMLSSDHGVGPAGRSAHFDYWAAHNPDEQDQIVRCLNDPARNSPNSPSCGVFTYDGPTDSNPALQANPWQVKLIAWANTVGYVRSDGNPGSLPPVTP